MSSRRQFIKNASILAGGYLLSSPFLTACGPCRKKKVIIIGGGLAGLMAGYTLQKRGIDFEILEARDRMGGRVFSMPMGRSNEFVVELGAEWVGEDHHKLISLCGKLQLPLENNQFDTAAIYKGKYYSKAEDLCTPSWTTRYKALLADYRSLEPKKKEQLDITLDKTDWWRYLVDNGCPDTDLELRDLIDSTDFGESIRDVSALTAIGEYSGNILSKYNQMDYKIKGGNSRLAHALYCRFPEKVHMGRRACKIVQKDKVRVYCDDGYMAEGDKIICTIPTFAVSRIKWEPELPASMAEALRGLEYARINKNALLFSYRFWERENFDIITDMPGHYFYHATKNQTAPGGPGVLISYTIGDKAAVISNQADDERADLVHESLKLACPTECLSTLVQQQKGYFWGNDDYSRGAYAVFGKGQWFDLYDKLNATHLHTHFAGEHLSEDYGGFMEGALETGEEVALRI